MAASRKPLHPYEQSMLLVAMLFDRKNLADILKFLPDEQSERMNIAKDKFLALERNDRITQIILELRRLLLIDENRIDWIHQSWIDDALANEPFYLRPIIAQSLAHRSHKGNERAFTSGNHIPLPLIFGAFIEQLTKSPTKTAIYDPVLMRLQSIKDDAQTDIFSTIGRFSIDALGQVIDHRRLLRYLSQKGLSDMPSSNRLTANGNPFSNDDLRRHFLHELIQLKPQAEQNCAVFAGLTTTALYLLHHKYQWQRTIVLGLDRKLGHEIEQSIERASSLTIDRSHHALLSALLIFSLDHVGR